MTIGQGSGDSVEFTVDVSDFRALLDKSTGLEPVIRNKLRAKLRAIGQQAATEAIDEVLKDPLYPSRRIKRDESHFGLRASIAEGIRVKILNGNKRAGIVIVADAHALGDRPASLVRRYDMSSRKPWRHPVFGNTDKWVTETGRPYFGSVINKKRDAMTTAALAAMDEAVKEQLAL